MIDPFDSSLRSLRRARYHLGDLAEKQNAFTGQKPWSHVIERDVDGITHLHKIKFSVRMADEMPSIVFDCVQNIRAALDQMAYTIAALHTGNQRPKSCAFPFAATETDLFNKIRGACKDLPPVIGSLFGTFKPYKGGNNTLWAMNELANSKHFALVPMQVGEVGLQFTSVKNLVIPPSDIPLQYDPGKNETILFKTTLRPDAQYNANATFAIVLDHPEKIIRGQVPIFLLQAMIREVEAIGEITEKVCRAIGLIP